GRDQQQQPRQRQEWPRHHDPQGEGKCPRLQAIGIECAASWHNAAMHGRKSTDVRLARGAAALAFALIGWISGEAQAQRVPTHVACVGDSITYGYAASSSSKSYPSDLQVIFGSSVKVMNFGRNSATMLSNGDLPYINQSEYTAATTFVSGAGASAVVDVIIMLGTN